MLSKKILAHLRLVKIFCFLLKDVWFWLSHLCLGMITIWYGTMWGQKFILSLHTGIQLLHIYGTHLPCHTGLTWVWSWFFPTKIWQSLSSNAIFCLLTFHVVVSITGFKTTILSFFFFLFVSCILCCSPPVAGLTEYFCGILPPILISYIFCIYLVVALDVTVFIFKSLDSFK